MHKRRIKNLILNSRVKYIILPAMNLVRLIKFICTTDTLNFQDLNKIHPSRLQAIRSASNSISRFKVDYLERLGKDFSVRDKFRAHEFSVYSQHGEDGILCYILDKIGIKNHYFIELGAGGKTSNTEFLAVELGWGGLVIDGSKKQLDLTIKRIEKKSHLTPEVTACKSWITEENIDQLLLDNIAFSEVDVISIDIDGNDYWVWQAISSINPRVVIVEYNASLGVDRSLTIPYDPQFDRFAYDFNGWYHGASLLALTKLGISKGYSLVCCDSSGVNAFFVRNDLLNDDVTSNSVEFAYYEDENRLNVCSSEKQFEVVSGFEFKQI